MAVFEAGAYAGRLQMHPKRRTYAAVLAVIGGIWLSACAASALTERLPPSLVRLHNPEIKTLLVGKRIQFDVSAYDVTRGEGFSRDGAWERYGGRESESGHYTIKNDLLCVNDGTGDRCRRLFRSRSDYLIDTYSDRSSAGPLVKIKAITPF